MSFSSDMRLIIANAEKDALNKIIVPSLTLLVKEVSEITPVNTANLTANWELELNSLRGRYKDLFEFISGREDSLEIVQTKLRMILRKVKLGDTINMINSAPYSEKILKNGGSQQLSTGELYQVLADVQNSINRGMY